MSSQYDNNRPENAEHIESPEANAGGKSRRRPASFFKKPKPLVLAVLIAVVLIVACWPKNTSPASGSGDLYIPGAELLPSADPLTDLEDTESQAPAVTDAPTPTPTPMPTPIALTPENMLPEMRELYEQNDEIVGRITLYEQLVLPVMYKPGDNDYYLHRNFEGVDDFAGEPFVNYHCSCYPRSTNLVIYGHNMRNGTIFHTLQYYKSEEFYQDYPTIKYETLLEEETYEVFSTFVTQIYSASAQVYKFYKFYNADTEEDFNNFVNYCDEHRLYETGVTPQYGDEFITLVTCDYAYDNGRFVVVARKIPKDE